MRSSIRFLSVAMAVCLLTAGACAQILTYNVTGTVNADASKIDLPVYVPLPTTISGSLVYNTASADSDPDTGRGLYLLESLTLTMGGYTVTAAPGAMLDVTANPLSYLAYTNNGRAFIPEAGQTFTGIQVRLFDLVSSAAGADAFPLSPPDPTAFDSAEFSVKYANPGLGIDIDVVGTVNTIVPEPATLSLLALAPFFLRRKRR